MPLFQRNGGRRVNLARIDRLPDLRPMPTARPVPQSMAEPTQQATSVRLSSLVPGLSERACFFGKTGAGKTTLASKLLRLSGNRFVIVDCKHTVRIDNVPVSDHYDKTLDYQIIRPDPGNEIKAADAIIRQAWNDGEIIIYIDELTLVNPTAVRLNPELARAIRTGRERNVGVWMASQRPKSIPSSVFTESERFYVFRLLYEGDRDKVSMFTSDAMYDIQTGLKGYDFAFFDVVTERLLTVHQSTGQGGYT